MKIPSVFSAKIFTLMMGRRFLRPFGFGLGLFSLLIFLGDLFDKMHFLVKTKASLGIIMQYLWLEVPTWGIRVIPMATLLATLVALTGFIQSGEWIAAQSTGFKTSDFWKPLLYCSLGVTILSFVAQETLLPFCQRRTAKLWREEIHPEWEWDKFFDIVMLVGRDPERFLQAKLFIPKEGRLERPVYEKIGPNGLEYQLDAKLALWDANLGHWVFEDGVERTFKGGLEEKVFKKHDSDFTAEPKELLPRPKVIEEMSAREVRRALMGKVPSGLSQRELRVALFGKLAYPFTNLVICALGIPIAMRLRRHSKIFAFACALVVSFLFLWLQEMGRALGMAGRMPPFIAAWLANVAFAAAAVGLLSRSELES
jgi:lipopolysaccharide export system permease protein